MLIGIDMAERLSGCHVAVLGLGGVGSWCAEALARSGIGRLTIADNDCFSYTNINRQLGALHSTVGLSKVSVTEKRLRDINPDIELRSMEYRYEASSSHLFFDSRYDFIADAIDTVSAKLHLIENAHNLGIPIISALGTGNKLDPTRLEIADISETSVCPLARVMRREMKKRGIFRHTVVYSREEPISPQQEEEPPPGRRSVPGSVVWVPAAAGLIMASYVVKTLIKP